MKQQEKSHLGSCFQVSYSCGQRHQREMLGRTIFLFWNISSYFPSATTSAQEILLPRSVEEPWEGNRHLESSLTSAELSSSLGLPASPPEITHPFGLFCLCSVPLLVVLLSPKGRGDSRWHRVGQEAYNALRPGIVGPKYCPDFCCFAVCSYCSTDLYSLWSAVGRLTEASIRLFAAELILVLCK